MDRQSERLIEAVGPLNAAEAFLDAWQSVEALARDDERTVASILEAGANLPSALVSASSLDLENFAVAMTDARGLIIYSDDAFSRMFADVLSPFDIRRIALTAGTGGVSITSTASGNPVAVLAIDRSRIGRWRALQNRFDAAGSAAVVLLVHLADRFELSTLQAAKATGLTAVEGALVCSLATAENLEVAARHVGLGRETAKDILRRATRKVGATTASQAIGRLTELACDVTRPPSQTIIQQALRLSPAEARVAIRIGGGDTATETAKRLGMTAATVKSYRKAVFDKVGANRSRQLGRLVYEATALSRLSDVREVVASAEDRRWLKVIFTSDGRRVAYLDFGPPGRRAVILGHGYLTGRLPPPPMLNALAERGFRTIVPQRPGFGLTTPAAHPSRYLEACSNDLRLILDSTEVERAQIIARDGGVASALDMAARSPDRLGAGLLLNPRQPKTVVRPHTSPMAAFSRLLLNHPALIDAFAEMVMRQSRTDFARRTLSKTFAAHTVDRAAIAEPAVLDHLLTDLLGTFACSSLGFQMEQKLYSDGWAVPSSLAQGNWTVVLSGALGVELKDAFADVPARHEILEGAGFLAQFTHADELAALLDERKPPKEGSRVPNQPAVSPQSAGELR